jgi:hypothetical protein
VIVKAAIDYFLESAEINVCSNDLAASDSFSDLLPHQNVVAHLPASLQKAIQQHATQYDFPPEFVVEMAITFLLDPDASSFEDCQTGIQREQVYWLQNFCRDR